MSQLFGSFALLPPVLITTIITNTQYQHNVFFFLTSHLPFLPDFSSDTVPLLMLDPVQRLLHTKPQIRLGVFFTSAEPSAA